ncbi:MAG TPA: hypothetical protein VLZ06_09955 [Solirubrobacteraceae bacterium]|nr:hypothetical protein [Solirubrobacteraceae bacterium]
MLRVFARESEARSLQGYRSHVPEELRGLLHGALSFDPVCRPSAAEWQRALHRVVADPHVSRLHPGPRPPVRTRPHTSPGPFVRERRMHAPATAPPNRGHGGRGGARGQGWNQPLFTTAWLIAGIITLLLFVHLLAAASIHPSNTGGRVLRSPSEYRILSGEGGPSETVGPEEETRSGEFLPSR